MLVVVVGVVVVVLGVVVVGFGVVVVVVVVVVVDVEVVVDGVVGLAVVCGGLGLRVVDFVVHHVSNGVVVVLEL